MQFLLHFGYLSNFQKDERVKNDDIFHAKIYEFSYQLVSEL